MKIPFLQKKKLVITHSGSFHPDDVFATATLTIFLESHNQEWQIIRTRDSKIIETGNYVLDVGGIYNPEENKFDHHQFGGAGTRVNGAPLASFGLVWKKFGPLITHDENIANRIDDKLVSPIDCLDNGVGNLHPIISNVLPYTIGHFIRNLNQNWLDGFDEKDEIQKFNKAVTIAKDIIKSEIRNTESMVKSEKIIDELYAKTTDKRYLIIDKNYPWNLYVQKFPELLFVIEPSKRGENFELEAVKTNKTGFENRKNLPKEWAGLRDRDLQEITGVKDAIFCHNMRFFAVAKSLDGVKALVKKALEN